MTETQRKHILSKLDFSRNEVMFDNMCNQLKLVLSGELAYLEVEGIETDKNEDDDQVKKRGARNRIEEMKKLS